MHIFLLIVLQYVYNHMQTITYTIDPYFRIRI